MRKSGRYSSLVIRHSKGADAMEDLTKRLSRRSFLRALGAAGGAAVAGSVLAACGGSTPTAPAATSAPAAEAPTAAPAAAAPTSAPAAEATAAPAAEAPTAAPAAAGGGQTVSLLWSDTDNARQPLLDDFTKATGIKVNSTRVQYNELLNKINTATQGGGDLDVVEIDTIWTAQFASAGWIDDLTPQITDAIKKDVPDSALSA